MVVPRVYLLYTITFHLSIAIKYDKIIYMKNECFLCPVKCGVDRNSTAGYCGEKLTPRIAKYYLHKFEEPAINGKNGSGTVFFCGCSLKCVFCQNFALSRSQTGKEVTPKALADIFKELESRGAANVNLVTPTHFAPAIAEAFAIYKPKIPVVYNTHSYETEETLDLLKDYIDVYLPDLKFYSPEISLRYTGKRDYFAVASKAIEYMMSLKKTEISPDGEMKSGVIVRHMVMPLCVEDSKRIVEWFAANCKNGAYFSLMAQYTPFGKIENFPELQRKITAREYERVYEELLNRGITDYFAQERGAAKESFIPEWDF